MNKTKMLLAVLAAVLLLAANIHVVYAVSVAGEEVPGTFSSAQITNGENAALAAAEEISRCSDDCAVWEKSVRISLSPPSGDTHELTRALLKNAGGVDTAWNVTVGDADVGKTSDPTALGEVLETILAGGAVHEAVAVEFTDNITLRQIFVPEGQDYDLMALAKAIRGETQVMSVTSDGTARYG